MLAVRSNERAAAAAGINVRNVKLAAFGISSFIAGISGALYGYNFSSVTVNRFSALTALSLIALAYVGGDHDGLGSDLRRPDLGRGAVPVRAREVVRDLRELGAPLRGLALIVTLIQNPDGVAGAFYRKRRQKQKQRAAVAPRRRILALTGKEL